ncbi:MAG: helix-turn-helix transcriptional regulator [Peptoniphilaceae bacterium]|nr:helix-turn-helix transcriptional regulator [Peptoniphilaceae bacterium]MDD7382887.1 helix-turn-helix transcriptional regulator [Peptoniphilaceae bacterium]MDY3738154.1 helix-turn-helix transcriptional regulator [Peptoniphilaceae bacterium]
MKKNINLMDEIPLTETAYLVLLTMTKPNHGYGAMQDVEKLTNGRVVFGPGTLYGAINNLEKKGWIELDFNDKKNRKKIYKITEVGKQILHLELERMDNLVKASRNLLEGE